jgi:hypothetical protein
MSTLTQQHTAAAEITEESIADYLQANPEFFERHSSLLNSLRLPHNAAAWQFHWSATVWSCARRT